MFVLHVLTTIIIIINMLMPAYQGWFYTSKSPIGAPGAAALVRVLLGLLAQSN